MDYKNKLLEIAKKEYESKFNGFRGVDIEEIEKNVNEKLSKLPIHQLLKQINFSETLWDSGAVSLYPSSMWDGNSIYPRSETGYAYTEDMKKELVEKFNTQIFNQGSFF